MAADLMINITESSAVKESVLVSNESLHIFFLFTTCALIPTCLLGVITNCLNIISYTMIGFQDSATSCFFALSVSDLGSVVIFLAITVSCLIKIHLPDLPINIFDLVFILSSDLSMVYNICIVLKTYIAIQQGCCVVFPFHMKHLFTRRRTIAVVVFVYAFCIACHLPSLCLKSLRAVTDPLTNRTERALYLKNGWLDADSFVNIFNKTILIFACQVLILISLIAIVSGLSASSRYQQRALVGDYSKMESQISRRLHLPIDDKRPPGMDQDIGHRGNHTGQHTGHHTGYEHPQPVGRKPLWKSKELRVLKQVTLVSGIFFACNIPAVVISIANRVVPEFEYRDIYSNLIWVLFTCSYFAGLINSSTTFFIYCNFNSKFIEAVRKLMGLRTSE